MVAKHDRNKVHKGRRKLGRRIRRRLWALRNDKKVRKFKRRRRGRRHKS